MNEKRFISMHDTESAAMGKIEELRAKGYHDSHIYVVTKHEDNVSILRRDTDVHTEATYHGNWFDKVRAFLSGHEDVHAGLKSMGLSEDEVKRHYEDVENGKILIYVDEEFEHRHNEGLAVDSKPYQDYNPDGSYVDSQTSDGLEVDSEPFNKPKTTGTDYPGSHSTGDVEIDGEPNNEPKSKDSSHPGHHTADGLEVDSKPYQESKPIDPNRPVDPEQEKLDEETARNEREKKLRGLDDRAYRNDVEDPDNVRRF
ncbi:general stress protein [Exiguobacterium algae]|uniref:general stress protein n=1 Tax=Exiguobacterium algae TaxID=2751250 RepID=UPI001BEBA4D0|nr:general stress protein [Exiguobacterium algae]